MSEVERLKRLAAAPGAPAFPALAEALRRAGFAKDAERVAREGLHAAPDRVSGRVSLALALLDQGRSGEALPEFERVLDRVPDHPLASVHHQTIVSAPVPEHPFGSPPPPVPVVKEAEEGVSDGEIEEAFLRARSEPEPLDVDDVASQAVAEVSAALDDELGPELDPELGPEIDPAFDVTEPGSPFATETVAQLLENQGAGEEAEAVRSTLSALATEVVAAAGQPDPEPTEKKRRAVRELQRWLGNLRRENP